MAGDAMLRSMEWNNHKTLHFHAFSLDRVCTNTNVYVYIYICQESLLQCSTHAMEGYK